MLYIYLLINEAKNKTYVGWTANLEDRLNQHRLKNVKSTKDFGDFQYYILESFENSEDGRKKEKYWKSSAGRKKIKIIIEGPSSSG